MGILGCPASFQRLIEGVLRDIPNGLVYIDDLLVKSIYKFWIRYWHGYTKITSKSTWRNAYSATRKSCTWASLSLQTGSNQARIN
jgi:hypothetical protein